MTKYIIWLGDNWGVPEPLQIPWDYELIGDALREEFDTYYDDLLKKENIVTGGTRRILKGEALKQFMLRKQINLVDDPNSKGLKSVFILKVGEKKTVDERAWKSLLRYEKKEIKRSDGTASSVLGFLEWKRVGPKPEETKPLDIKGEDVSYFSEEKEIKEPTGFKCEECGKEFKTKRQLGGHMISHKRK